MQAYFENVVGAANVLYKDTDLKAYSYDASGMEQMPALVVFPSTKEELHKIIKYCNRLKAKMVVRGGGSGHQGGAIGRDAIVIDMSHFNRVLSLDMRKGTVEVEAGVLLEKLQSFLAEQNLTLAFDFAYRSVRSIGGIVGTNPLFSRSLYYGDVANQVVAINAFDATGKFYETKKKEIEKFCGTEGRIGIITSVVLKIHPLLQEVHRTIFQFEDKESLLKKVGELKTYSQVLSLEFLDKRCSSLMGLGKVYMLLCESFEELNGEVVPKNFVNTVFQKRAAIASLLKRKENIFEEDVQVDFHKIKELLSYFEEEKRPCYGHIGLGVLHAHYKRNENRLALYTFIRKLDGVCGPQFGYGSRKAFYTPINLRNRIKRLLLIHNPQNYLSPGKMLREHEEEL